MSIAEELIDFRTSDNNVITRKAAIAAINAALELAAHDVEWFGYHNGHSACSELFAARIRALKSPAHPIEPSHKQNEHA